MSLRSAFITTILSKSKTEPRVFKPKESNCNLEQYLATRKSSTIKNFTSGKNCRSSNTNALLRAPIAIMRTRIESRYKIQIRTRGEVLVRFSTFLWKKARRLQTFANSQRTKTNNVRIGDKEFKCMHGSRDTRASWM